MPTGHIAISTQLRAAGLQFERTQPFGVDSTALPFRQRSLQESPRISVGMDRAKGTSSLEQGAASSQGLPRGQPMMCYFFRCGASWLQFFC
jgi:hypothetical protein